MAFFTKLTTKKPDTIPLKKLTTYATDDTLDTIAFIQSQHRRKTGERIPVWKVIDMAIKGYAEKQGIRLK
jgi:hypothetical protein